MTSTKKMTVERALDLVHQWRFCQIQLSLDTWQMIARVLADQVMAMQERVTGDIREKIANPLTRGDEGRRRAGVTRGGTMDDDRVRSAIFEATAFGWGRTEILDVSPGATGFYRSDARIVDGLNAGKVLAMVDRQRLAVRNWLYFAYGCEFRRSEYEAAARALCDAMVVVEHRAKRRRTFDAKITVTSEDMPRYECLCRLALNNFRWRQYRLAALPERAMEVALDVARGSFADHWRGKLARLENEVGRWDAEGVGNVGASVDEIVFGRPRKKTLA